MRRGWVFVGAALGSLAPATASAAGAVFGQAGEAVTMTTARVAVATSPGRSALWAQVSVAGARAGFVWVLPVRPGARIDAAPDAWLDALDAATAPVVDPPTARSCDAAWGPELLPAGASPSSTPPAATGLFTDAAALGAFAASAGYAVPDRVVSALAQVWASGGEVLAATFPSADLPTRPLRIVDGGPPALPLALTGSSSESAHVTAFVIAAAGATAGSSPLVLDGSQIVWQPDGTSTFAAERDDLITLAMGARWLTVNTSPGLMFDGFPDGGGVHPPVFTGYAELASAYGEASLDPTACAMAARATGGDAETYAPSCPPGVLAVVAGPDACASDDAGGAPVDALTCGGQLSDAALAVASLAPSAMWVTRIEGLATSATASDVPLSVAPTTPWGPVVTAAGYTSPCPAPNAPPAGTVFTPWLPPPAPAPQPQGPPPPSSADVAAATAEGCGAAADGCSSTNSTGDDGNDQGGGCGSSDPPSESSDSGGGCGSSSPSDGSSSNCTAAAPARGRRRSPVSRILFVAAAALAITRRRTRL